MNRRNLDTFTHIRMAHAKAKLARTGPRLVLTIEDGLSRIVIDIAEATLTLTNTDDAVLAPSKP